MNQSGNSSPYNTVARFFTSKPQGKFDLVCDDDNSNNDNCGIDSVVYGIIFVPGGNSGKIG